MSLDANTKKVLAQAAALLASLVEDAPATTAPAKKAPAKAVAGTTKKAVSTKAAKAKAAKTEGFLTWMRETAEQRAARKATNAELATLLRSKGVVPNGTAWALAQAGERNVTALKAANAKDAKVAAKAKAAKV